MRVRLASPLGEDEREPFVAAFTEAVERAVDRPPGVLLVDLRGCFVGGLHPRTVFTAIRRLAASRVPRCAVVVDDWKDARAFAGLAAEIEHHVQMRVFLCGHRGEPALAVAWLVYETPVPEPRSPLFKMIGDEEP